MKEPSTCIMCCLLLHDPVSRCSELHMLCLRCFDKILPSGGQESGDEQDAVPPSVKCPSCREEQGPSVRCRPFAAVLELLNLRCPHASFHGTEEEVAASEVPAACTWVGERGKLAAHLGECDFEEVECLSAGCTAHVARKDLWAHRKTPWHLVHCEHAGCNAKILRHLREHHMRCCLIPKPHSGGLNTEAISNLQGGLRVPRRPLCSGAAWRKRRCCRNHRPRPEW